MKTLLLTVLLISTFSLVFSQSQWIPLESGTDNQLTYMCFLNIDTGFVVGSNVILKTEDGGLTWIKNDDPGSQVSLSSVDFVNDTLGYACGYDGVLIKTVNSGESWSYLDSNFPGTFYSIDFINPDTGYTVGYWGYILKTTNGGETWDTLSHNQFPLLYDVKFLNENVGFAVGQAGTIIRTIDGGTTWYQIYSSFNESFFNVNFYDLWNGFITGGNGIILKTVNGGNDWSFLLPIQLEFLNTITYATSDLVYIAASEGYILKTENNGIYWTPEKVGFDGRLIALSFPSPTIGYAAGDQGMIYKLDVTASQEQISKDDIIFYPNPAKEALFISGRKSNKGDVNILNTIGEIVLKSSGSRVVDIRILPPGLYFIKIDGEIYKFVKI